MNISIYLGTFLGFSTILNAFLLYRINKKPPRPQSVELQEFLADLLSGVGIVAIGRVDPSSILMRSPKSK